jgi:cytochrome c5
MKEKSKLIIITALSILAIMAVICGQSSSQETILGQPSDEGAAILEARCSVCHSADRVESKRTDRDGWDKLVTRMISNGANLSSEEKNILIDYLSRTYPAK